MTLTAFSAMASAGGIPPALRAAGAHHLCRYLPKTATSNCARPQVGVVSREDRVVWPLHECITDRTEGGDLLMDAASIGDMVGVIRAWAKSAPGLQLGGDGTQLDSVVLHAPLEPPRNVLCVGKNYAPHVSEVDTSLPGIAAGSVPTAPIIFTKAPQCVVGPEGAIRLPRREVSTSVDYEGEIGLVLGMKGQVFGVTCVNDVTARDAQKRHQQWFLGKSCDTFCPLGPWLTLADAVDWRSGLGVVTRVNGEERQRGDGSQLIFTPETLLDTISAGTTLIPGDVIATGTPAGVGAGFNPPRFLKAGDVVEVEVEGVGVLRNTVAPPSA